MSDLTDYDLFPPGEYIRDELEARDWRQEDLADILGRPLKTVNQVISGKKAITPQTAQELAAAFGTSAELWLNLESAYRLALGRREQEAVARRARVYEVAPIRDMVGRRWIGQGGTVQELEGEVLKFFELRSINDPPTLGAAARRSTSYEHTTPAQKAWLFRAKHLAETLEVKPFSKGAFDTHLAELRSLRASHEAVREVPTVLARMGVRFLIIEHLPRTRIDGATLWLDGGRSPVIALSLRYDRIDCFWHTLSHELSHVKHRDGLAIDEDLVGASRRASEHDVEKRADQEAAEFLVPSADLECFIARVRPRYSKRRIVQFANLHQIHPGIIVGQLQHRGEIKYSHSREMLVRVRDMLTEVTLTDGWGVFPPIQEA